MKHRNWTEVCNQLVPWPMMLWLYTCNGNTTWWITETYTVRKLAQNTTVYMKPLPLPQHHHYYHHHQRQNKFRTHPIGRTLPTYIHLLSYVCNLGHLLESHGQSPLLSPISPTSSLGHPAVNAWSTSVSLLLRISPARRSIPTLCGREMEWPYRHWQGNVSIESTVDTNYCAHYTNHWQQQSIIIMVSPQHVSVSLCSFNITQCLLTPTGGVSDSYVDPVPCT